MGWKEIQSYMRRNADTIRKYAREQGLPITRFGKNVVISRALIDQWLITRHEFAARARPGRYPSAQALGKAIAIKLAARQIPNSPPGFPFHPDDDVWTAIAEAALEVFRRQ